MKQPPSRIIDYRRLARRNLPSLLTFKFLNEYGYDKGEVVVKAIVKDIFETIRRYYRRKDELEPGQLIYLAPHKDERAGRGKTMAMTRLVPVVLTIVAQEEGGQRRRRSRGAPGDPGQTSEPRGLRAGGPAVPARHRHGHRPLPRRREQDCDCLGKRGEFLPLRGYVCDMGKWPTHKVAIIRLYLQGMLTPDIVRRTFHTKESVDRYIRDFDRVRMLGAKFSRNELPLLTGMSALLIDEYLKLIGEHDALPKEGVACRSGAQAIHGSKRKGPPEGGS